MEIEYFFENYKEHTWNKDAPAMINLYDEHALIFDMWDQGYISGLSEWSKVIVDWFDSLGEEKVKVEFEMVKIHQSGDVGFATALIEYQAISGDGSVLRSMKNRISLGFSRVEDGWKVIHQHTSAPISSDELTAILDI
jgi:ketosteroid isomerase-like protein